uniref:Glutathione S-transferase delta-epsilon 2 n=1 Tax=Pseudodiaptomus poplesia TaxID=213370 RepID=A0A1S6GL69_9MAXI|nr:glutathione S-transferase delta-epsilon 2 [Pseudodiaptomus poplesia]
MAPIEIYGMQLSAPCRIVEMTCEMLGLEYNFNQVDLMAGEHMKPEYLAINPQHNIPAIVDGEFKINESRAIAGYLAHKYGKDDTLYPKDPETRAIVDQRMYFDMGVFYKACGDFFYPAMFGKGNPAGEAEHNRLKEVLGWLDGWVSGGKYMAGTDSIPLGDLSLVAPYATLKGVEFLDLWESKTLDAWFEKGKPKIPNYGKVNGEGGVIFGGFYKSKVGVK